MQCVMDDQRRLVRFPVLLRNCSLLQTVLTDCGTKPASYWVDTGTSSVGDTCKTTGVRWPATPHLVPRLRMRGANHPLPYTFIAYTVTILLFPYWHNWLWGTEVFSKELSRGQSRNSSPLTKHGSPLRCTYALTTASYTDHTKTWGKLFCVR